MAPCLSHRSVQGLVWKTGSDFLSLERKIYLSFSLYLLLRLSLYLIEVYIIELQILQLSLLQILRQPLQILQRSLQILQRSLQLLQLVRMVYGGGIVWGVRSIGLPQLIRNNEKAPAGQGILPRPTGAMPALSHHVSLMALPYRLAKSLFFSRYTSVLMPFTSSTTSRPSSR